MGDMSEEIKEEMKDKASQNNNNAKVEKVIPNPLERALDAITVNTIGKIIPSFVTPNMMTSLGAIGGAIGIAFAFLAKINPLFLIGTCFGVCAHLVCDNLDGHIARKKNMMTKSGAYYDLLTDILHITYLLIALAFSEVVNIKFVIFLVPVYALIIFTSMNEIHYLNKFSFPTLGPSETHLFFLALLIGSMITGCKPLFTLFGIDFKIGDIIAVVGGIPMYIEMIRLQISVFLRIKKQDVTNSDNNK